MSPECLLDSSLVVFEVMQLENIKNGALWERYSWCHIKATVWSHFLQMEILVIFDDVGSSAQKYLWSDLL